MNGLTKQNTFDFLKGTYPLAHHLFLAWIDEQKKALQWNEVFNSNSDYQDINGKNAIAPKFHNLPFELQFGILCKFIKACKPLQPVTFNYEQTDIQRILIDTFRSIEGKIQAGFLDKI